MPAWKTLSSEIVYETPWITVRRNEVLNHKGKPLTYSVVDTPNPAVVVVAERDGCVFVQQNYRYPIRRVTWELPAGGANKNEDLKTAAQRELLEETGLISDDWTDLGRFYHVLGLGDLPYNIFLARGVRSGEQSSEEHEEFSNQQFMTWKEVEQLILAGELPEGAHISAFYIARAHIQKKQQEKKA